MAYARFFREAPVARELAGDHLAAIVVDLGHARVEHDLRRDGIDRGGEGNRAWCGRHAYRPGRKVARQVFRPVGSEFSRCDGSDLGGDFARVELVAVVIHQRLDAIRIEDAFGDEPRAIDLPHGLVRAIAWYISGWVAAGSSASLWPWRR